LFILLLTGSCTNYQIEKYALSLAEQSDLGGCNLLDVTYEGTIVPILQEHCVACHNNNSAAAGYNYADFDRVLESVIDGSLMGTIDQMDGFSPMPPGNPMDSCSTEKIRTWISGLESDSIPSDSIPEDPIISNCDPDTVYFRNTILPLVVSSCATTGCHDEASHKDGIILTDYASIIRTGKIKAGDPNDSEFFETLTDTGDDLMPPPPGTPLGNDQILLIEQWIRQGAKDNFCNDGCDTTGVTFSDKIWPMMQQYCTGCHSVSSPGGGIVIEGYGDLVALAGNGSLMGSVRYETGYSQMPTNQQLSECNIGLIQKWIDEGFPE
jgi:mono/diheme cytochrome c family protein